MSADKYPSIFSLQMEAIVYINTSEILSELSRVNMIPSYVKITCYFYK